MNYSNLSKRFFVSKILFILVIIGFVSLIYLHSFSGIISNSLLLRFLGIILLSESIAKALIFPYKNEWRTLNIGRVIRIFAGLYLIFHLA